MCLKVILVTFTALLQKNHAGHNRGRKFGTISSQRQWVPPTTTAAEMWNPYTWYWPYAIAASEGYREWFMNAQQITNQLYTQAYATNAFWWTNRPGGGGNATGQIGGAAAQAGGAAGQAGGAAGQAGGTGGQATGGGNQPVGNMAQGGTGWGK